ncbi:MAG: ankyrin repeat domain-containing protein, partial [Gemmatimonadaceae bacterium]
LLDQGAKINVRGPSLFGDTTPLLQAAYNGDESTFHLLIERGADPTAEGPPTLGFALRARCLSCAETLMKGFDPVRLTQTMLGSGPPRGPALAMPLFVGRGVDVNAKDPDGRTALMLAAASDAMPVDVIQMLIASGADVNATNAAGETALGFARLRGETAITKLLEGAGATTAATPMPAHPMTFSPAPSARAALSRALPLLQQSDKNFMEKSGCVSCHHNTLTAMTVDVARTRGLAVDETTARHQVTAISSYLGSWKDRALQGIGIPGDANTVSYILLGLAAERYPADVATDAMARFLLGQQAPDGHWQLLAHRPPIESSEIQATALAMHALQVYAPASNRAPYQQAVQRAGAWIAAATPQVNEDRPFHLLGLHWSGAGRPAIGAAARALLAEQRQDGGFAQLPSLPSDAYATGQALVALAQSRAIPVTHPAFTRGVRFLLKTQLADGSWFVKSRALPIQPHFESGFPHGRDQFISAAATNWAALALALSSPAPPRKTS